MTSFLVNSEKTDEIEACSFAVSGRCKTTRQDKSQIRIELYDENNNAKRKQTADVKKDSF